MPTGVESKRSDTKASRVSASLKTVPPNAVGTTRYQIMYAAMIQKYTSGCPKYQKSIRVSETFTPEVQPSDHGIRISISAVTPSVAMIHMISVHTEANAGNGMSCFGFCFLNHTTFSIISAETSHVPATSSVAPR